jgi:hypothetical protein
MLLSGLRALEKLIFYIYEQTEQDTYQSLKMPVLQPIRFAAFRENLSSDLPPIVNYLEEQIRDDLVTH